MAFYSKEWMNKYGFDEDELLDPNDTSYHDFSIEEEFKTLKVGNYRPLICEGYGFSGILNIDGVWKIIYTSDPDDYDNVEFVGYSYLDTFYKDHYEIGGMRKSKNKKKKL